MYRRAVTGYRQGETPIADMMLRCYPTHAANEGNRVLNWRCVA